MRVALVSIGDPRDVGVWSGIPFSIKRELEQSADSVEIIAPLHRWFKYFYAPARLLHRLRGKPYQFDRRSFALRSYARQVERRMRGKTFDVIFATSSIPIAALDTDVPIIYWTDAVLEGMIGYYSGFNGYTRREIAIGHRQEQAALDRAAFAAYASEWAVETIRSRYRCAEEKLVVVHFGANIEIQHTRDDVQGFVERRLQGPVTLLFIGVDWERKGGPLAWEATRLLNEQGIAATLRVVGCAAPEAPFIENLGFISKATPEGQERLRQILTEATVFLFPTRAEAAGCVFAEASAFGLPIVATDTGGVRDYVRPGINGFTLPLEASAGEYAETVRGLLQNASLYRELSIGGYELYVNDLNWSVGVRGLLARIQAGKECPASMQQSPSEVI